MNTGIVKYEANGPIANIKMDDGKRNVISPTMISELHDALDRAQKDQAVVVLTGREDVFSAGFDLKILKGGNLDTITMLTGGFELAKRLLSFPTPVVMACNGHALAMGAFLLLSGDYRVAANGPFKIGANEVAIGLTMPRAGIDICRYRLTSAHFTRAALLAEIYTPEGAADAGFVDQVVPADELTSVANELALKFASLDLRAHYQTKLSARRQVLLSLKKSIKTDRIGFLMQGANIFVKGILPGSTSKKKHTP
ncbi:enoyl-CoA hydratase [Hahella sp. CCB-MM4]|uniref:crotonase/enoyl-CoA hydratase family protein n=1 Tax=Hahella sp. (strain CCB-MM4) TaxID=1926491 RepID=UPI000BDCC6E9|nr:crotonase/enoyl-CoA hydratase family protein [Hahella sp. CCB-MM4]OZG72834.1 enoyl-CoA hydratase [Hahella sp. CCB-MM4]